jgi:hypothetical protein
MWYEDNFEEPTKKVSSPKKSASTPTPSGKTFRDPAMDEDEQDEDS